MKYNRVKRAVFLKRPNRFIGHVLIDNKEETVHVKNTGRCKEILKSGAQVILEESKNPERKTRYSLISCYKNDNLINIDSQVPNAVVFEAVKNNRVQEIKDVLQLRREVTFKNSRFDLYFKDKTGEGFIEVKGVTLETDGVSMFPDAPTERGTKHIYEMIEAVKEGYKGFIFFLIQMEGVNSFTPNEKMDPQFTKALRTAYTEGVNILAYDAIVTEDEINIGKPIDIIL